MSYVMMMMIAFITSKISLVSSLWDLFAQILLFVCIHMYLYIGIFVQHPQEQVQQQKTLSKSITADSWQLQHQEQQQHDITNEKKQKDTLKCTESCECDAE